VGDLAFEPVDILIEVVSVLAPLSQPNARAATVLRDEFYSGRF
jgi:hypothetical protein